MTMKMTIQLDWFCPASTGKTTVMEFQMDSLIVRSVRCLAAVAILRPTRLLTVSIHAGMMQPSTRDRIGIFRLSMP